MLENWIKLIKNKKIYEYKEEQLQKDFINLIFRVLLNYNDIFQNSENWNLETEHKTDVDGQKADAILEEFSNNDKKVFAVVELKDPNYRDLDKKQNRQSDKRSPIEQAFGYAPKYSGGQRKWIIVSNFNEIRLYDQLSLSEYEVFYIENLLDDYELSRLLYLMSKEHIIENKLFNKVDLKIKEEESIEKKFYNKYKKIRYDIIKEIINSNNDQPKNILIKKHKNYWIDFLFIAFCEDKNFIPTNIFRTIIESSNNIITKSDAFRTLCSWINTGNKSKGINKFNGGLFKEDDILDNLTIPDIVFDNLIEIANYDFSTDVDENILGHIFEQSLSDLEELKKYYSGETFDKKDSKRKIDGVFYTPKYITKK
ncbi:type IIL restriction-modification enzyme MmeI [Gemelliphila palaticanis]|uniref:MmeI-like N-terminal domain-containing protein n=1 Tax=Gemelliphila palaticanis TaxID=81950 RepID=A0ABX2SXY1_9BACL|nr:type IIL restriction-modification enzyme MmeI [Gemella palaticanis]MBF0714888.1 hypothetical protein [Gemella palaticanis]NYS46818.1 hypothetical protein [Gemella palaticanis]